MDRANAPRPTPNFVIRVGESRFKLLHTAPFAAATYVATASGGVFELMGEMLAAGRFLEEVAQLGGGSPYGELVGDVVATVRGMSRDELRRHSVESPPDLPPDFQRQHARRIVVDVAALLDDLPGGDGYRRFVLDMARRAAEASRGGFLGIGAAKDPVDARERAALDDLAAVLGVNR